jgi:hypothetical protein
MAQQTDQFMTHTLEFWQARTKRELTLEDARQIAENMGTFCEILLGLDLQANQTPQNPAVK